MNRFEDELKKTKEQFDKLELREEFKDKLRKKMDEEYYSTSNKRKYYFPKQIVAACVCFVIFSSCAFAGQWGDFISNLFNNTYPEFDDGVGVNELIAVNTDYIEHDGVSIKVDYVLQKENSLYIVFNILADREFDDCFLEEVYIGFNNDKIIRNYDLPSSGISVLTLHKKIDKKNIFVLYEIIDDNLPKIEKINFKVKKCRIKDFDSGYNQVIDHLWNYEINI